MIHTVVATLVTMMVLGFGANPARAQALTCTQFASQAEAQAAYAADPTDPAGNDEDGDGVACENVIYGNTATDFEPVQAAAGAAGIGASGLMGGDAVEAEAGATGVGASGLVPAAQTDAQADTQTGVGASGLTREERRAERQAERQEERGIGAAGTTRGDMVGTMTTMPSTGVGATVAGSWTAAAVLLAVAMMFGALAATSARRVRHG